MQNGSEDEEVDVTECTKSGDDGLGEAESQNTTENSSSFGDTMSGTENVSTLNDVEVESPYSGSNMWTAVFDGYNGALPLRKKKLTDHWRKFVRPIMWRCKWLEVQIKEFESRALKYDRELAGYDFRKRFQFEETTIQDFDSKSRPFSCLSQRNEIMKRKKRKRIEENTDLASFMSCHDLLSYHGTRVDLNRSIPDGTTMDSECSNLDRKTVYGNGDLVSNEEWPLLEFRDGQYSMWQMLSKIELVQTRVRKLKTQIDLVVSENSANLSSVNTLSLLVNVPTNSDRDAASPPKSGNEMPDRSLYTNPPHISKCHMTDLMPGKINSSWPAMVPSDLISSGLPQVGDSCEPKKDGLRIHNQANQFTEKPQESTRKLDAIPPLGAPREGSPTTSSEPRGQHSTSRSNVRNKKRKWGSQKSRSRTWKRRSSG